MIISEMQSKLATWSTVDKERKFDRLLRLIADRAWLSEAARITLASSGAKTPGVDGIDMVQMEMHLHTELQTIRTVKWTHRSRQFFSEFKLCRLLSLQLVGAAP